MPNSADFKNNKICFFNSTKAWGGGEKWHFDAAVYLASKGWQVSLITNPESELFNRTKNNQNVDLKTLKVSNLSFLNPFTKAKLKQIFKKKQFDIIVLNLPADLKLAALIAKSVGIPHIIYRRGSAVPIRNTLLNRYLFGKILTGIIANSKATKQTILQNNPNLISEDKIKLIYNGLDFSNIRQKVPPKYYKRKGDELVLGNLGRLVRQKAQHYLIDIALELQKSNLNFIIIIGGSGVSEKELKDYAVQKKVADKIKFVGFVDDIPAFMQHIDIFLLTSLWEGFGYVIAEAMSFAKPVIAFNISSNPELIEDNKTGKLIEFDNIKAFSEAILELNDEKKRHLLGSEAQKNVINRFNKTARLQETENYFLSLL